MQIQVAGLKTFRLNIRPNLKLLPSSAEVCATTLPLGWLHFSRSIFKRVLILIDWDLLEDLDRHRRYLHTNCWVKSLWAKQSSLRSTARGQDQCGCIMKCIFMRSPPPQLGQSQWKPAWQLQHAAPRSSVRSLESITNTTLHSHHLCNYLDYQTNTEIHDNLCTFSTRLRLRFLGAHTVWIFLFFLLQQPE